MLPDRRQTMIRASVRHFGLAAGAVLGLLAVAAIPFAFRAAPARADAAAQRLPPPSVDVAPPGFGTQTAVFAGGCFWGIQGVFQHVKGVTQAVAGYAGGRTSDPTYELVSSGTTGYAESVQVTFDPARVSYGRLLQIFFSVALDPTEVDRQGPDSGTQYRSELFVSGPEQERVARAYVAQLDAAHAFRAPIATRIDPAGPFYRAEAYHQDYLVRHPDAPYIAFNDLPKVRSLQTLFPESWQDSPVTVGKLASEN
jgi:peptide-methionine (S)-S-oxide reductase